MTRTDPRDVGEADVYKGGQRAATLRRRSGHVEFGYLSAYLADGLPAVAHSLPLTDEPVVTVGGALPAFFANLLPEGRRLTALRRAVKTSADDELSLLVEVGADPVGDVQVLPAGVDPGATGPVTAQTAGSFSEIDFRDLLDQAGVGDPATLAGVQDKVSGRMLTVPLAHEGRAHLLKFEVPEFPHVVANEAYFLTRARRLRLPVVAAEVVHDSTGRPGLLVTRFDREIGPDGVVLRHGVEDGAQLLGVYPADRYAVSTESLAARIGEVCAARPVALRAVLTQTLFAWLTGNGDLHAKNLSVLRRAGEWRVAPAYDIPSTVPYGDSTTALPIGGKRSGLSRKAFLAFGAELGLPVRAVESTIDHVLTVTADLGHEVAGGALPFGQRRRRDLVRVLARRRHDLS